MNTLTAPVEDRTEELLGCPYLVAWWLNKYGGEVAGYARGRGPLTLYLRGCGLPHASNGPLTWDTAGYQAGPQLLLPRWAVEAQAAWNALPPMAPISGALAAWIIRDTAERLGIVEDANA